MSIDPRAGTLPDESDLIDLSTSLSAGLQALPGAGPVLVVDPSTVGQPGGTKVVVKDEHGGVIGYQG